MNKILHFQIFRVIINVVNCELKTVLIFLPVIVPFFPLIPSHAGFPFLCLTEKKDLRGGNIV
jgi:hypothetical protein